MGLLHAHRHPSAEEELCQPVPLRGTRVMSPSRCGLCSPRRRLCPLRRDWARAPSDHLWKPTHTHVYTPNPRLHTHLKGTSRADKRISLPRVGNPVTPNPRCAPEVQKQEETGNQTVFRALVAVI